MAGAGVVEDAPTGFRRGDVGLQRGATDLVRDRRQARTGRRDVDADDGGAVAREGASDLGPDAAGRPGDDSDLPDEGAVAGGGDGSAPADAEHLGIDVCGTRRQQELDGAQGRGLGAVCDEHEVGGRPGPQLLGHRAGDALERPLRRTLRGGTGQRRVTPDDDDPGAAAEPLQGGADGGPERLQVGRPLRGSEVDDNAAEPPRLGHLLDQGGPGSGQAVAQRGQGRGVGVAPDEHRAVDERAAGHLAAQGHRLG